MKVHAKKIEKEGRKDNLATSKDEIGEKKKIH